MSLIANVTSQIGDEEQLSALCSDLGSDVVAMLLDRARETISTGLAGVQDALENNDATQLREVAHSLKGASGSLFAMQLSEMAAQFEYNSAQLDVIKADYPAFEKAANDALAWWEAQLS